MDTKNISIGFIILFIILTLFIGFNNQQFVNSISQGDTLIALFFYFLTRVDYLIILYSFIHLNINTITREFTAGILMIFAVDILSFPRLPMDVPTADIYLLANSDAILLNKLISLTHLSYPIAWKIYYIVLPITLIILIGQILGLYNIKNLIRKN